MAGLDPTIEECFEEDAKIQKSLTLSNTAQNKDNERVRVKLLNSLMDEDMGNGRARGTHVPKWSLRITTNSTDALILSQLLYWLTIMEHKLRAKHGLSYAWIAKSAVDLTKELHLSEDAANKSLSRLRNQGFIDWHVKMFNGKPTRHIWVNWSTVQNAYEQVRCELSAKAHE